MNELIELLNSIKQDRLELEKNVQSPAEIEDTHKLKTTVLEKFGYKLDTTYMDILEIINGIDNDGTRLYATENVKIVGYEDRFIEGFLEANEIWHEDEYKKSFLVYAESDMYLFFQTMEDSIFYIVPRDNLDTIIYQTPNSIDFFKKILESCLGRFVE